MDRPAGLEARQTLSGSAVIVLPPRLDPDNRAVLLAERRDGTPCERPNCPYAYFFAAPMPNDARVGRAARERLRSPATRYFARVVFEDACAIDCRACPDIDEDALRKNDPDATARLRALRDAGADLLWVRSSAGERLAVVFTDSIGTRIRVLDEAEYSLRRDRWVREVLEPPPDEGWRAAVQRGERERWRPRLRRMAWELAIALICFTLAPLVVGIAGTEITLPLWSEALLVALLASAVLASAGGRLGGLRRGRTVDEQRMSAAATTPLPPVPPRERSAG